MSHPPIEKSRLSEFHRPLWYDVGKWVVHLPRLARIVVDALFALAVTFAVSPLVDYIYLSYMYTDETRILPSLVSAGAGIIMYIMGWWLIIGNAGQTPPVRRGVVWFMIVGLAAVILIIALAAIGWTSATAPM